LVGQPDVATRLAGGPRQQSKSASVKVINIKVLRHRESSSRVSFEWVAISAIITSTHAEHIFQHGLFLIATTKCSKTRQDDQDPDQLAACSIQSDLLPVDERTAIDGRDHGC
jgi:hypothetical protein